MNFDKLCLLTSFVPRDSSKEDPTDQMIKIIEEKQQEYITLAKRYRLFYYLTRLCVGLGAGLLPFTLQYPTAPKIISVVIVITTVLDAVFNPKNNWVLYSQATDLITLAMFKRLGHYDKFEEVISTVLETERAASQINTNLEDMLKKINPPQDDSERGGN